MSRTESRLPDIFYGIIDSISNDLWMKFVRLLGLAESDIQTVTGREHDFQEKKYQTLNRWKMYIGVLEENEIENILQKTREEIDCDHRYDCEKYSRAMKKNIAMARMIYGFIEQYEQDDWNFTARYDLRLKPADMLRIKSAYEDPMEKRYQMILRWIRVEQIGENVISERLLQIRQNPNSNRDRLPISNVEQRPQPVEE